MTYSPLWTCCPAGQIHSDVTLTYHLTDFQIIRGIVARVVPASDGQINFGTPPTTQLEIYGGVLFTVVERRDGPRRLHD